MFFLQQYVRRTTNMGNAAVTGECSSFIRRLGVKYLMNLDSLSIIHELQGEIESY
jgi:hypothetical protein